MSRIADFGAIGRMTNQPPAPLSKGEHQCASPLCGWYNQ
jgi:hypothetical protein